MDSSGTIDDNLNCKNCELTVTEFVELSSNPEHLDEFLYKHGVLQRFKKCPDCGNQMTLNSNGYFRCYKRVSVSSNNNKKKIVKKCGKRISQTCGTWFYNHHLSKKQICRFVALWVCFNPRQEALCFEVKISQKSCIDWCSFIREVCIFEVTRLSGVIGGSGKTVELGEAKFGNNKTSVNWVFGAIERGSRKCFFVPVQTPSSDSLLQIIQEYILPGTSVISGCWEKYNCLEHPGYIQLTADKSINFVDLDTEGAHKNTIDRIWREVRASVPKYGNTKNHLAGYLAEFMFRRLYPTYENLIHSIFTAIGRLYNGEKTFEPAEEPSGSGDNYSEDDI